MQIQTEAEAEVVGQAQAQVKVGEETGCHLANRFGADRSRQPFCRSSSRERKTTAT